MVLDYSENEIRGICKKSIESLELWSRRLINEKLSSVYGKDYFFHQLDDGNYLIKKSLVDDVKARQQSNAMRYPRIIDAILLDDIQYFFTRDDFYKDHFKEIFESFFSGKKEVESVFERLISIRNKLYHGNPISIREAEKSTCYTNDLIDIFKDYYIKEGLNKKYNVPLFIKIMDSKGNCFYREHDYDWDVYFHGKELDLHSGDTIKIWVEIDSSFEPKSYDLEWLSDNSISNISGKGNEIKILLTDKMVGNHLTIVCKLKTRNNWHKRPKINCDDIVKYNLGEILPPISSY